MHLPRHQTRSPFLLSGLIALIAVGVYLPTLRNNLIGWDDHFTIVNNPLLSPPSPESLLKIFSRFYKYDYYPVFYSTLWFDRLWWGSNPVGYHFGNLLLHAANSVLVFWLLWRLAGPVPGRTLMASLAGLVFCLHPVNVEPVAWATGRKILLAAFFSFLSFHAYFRRGNTRGKRGWYFLSLAFFTLGCLSNLSAAAMAFILFAYDLTLRRRRIGNALRAAGPFWLLGLLTLALKLWGRRDQPEVPSSIFWTDSAWLATVLSVYARNLFSLIFPFRLSARYASVVADLSQPWAHAGGAAAFMTLYVLLKTRRRPLIFFPLLWFLLGQVPLLQVIRHHVFRADRFLYLPGAGLFILFGLAAVYLLSASAPRLRAALIIFLVLAFGSLTIATERRIAVWRDDLALWTDALREDPGNALAHNHLGVALSYRGRLDEAIGHYRKAIESRPWIATCHRNLGIALEQQGKADSAILSFRRAIQIQPRFAEAHYSLAESLARRGEWSEAIDHYREAIRLSPQTPEYHGGIGYALEERGEFEKAEKHYREVLVAFPDSWVIHDALGLCLFRQGKNAEAIDRYRQALRLNPDFAQARNNLGNALAASGRMEEAARELTLAIKLQPDLAEAWGNLGSLYSNLGRWDEAEKYFREALRLNPGSAVVHNNYANALLRRGKFREAEDLYRRALKINPRLPGIASNLGVALINLGRYREAGDLLRARLEAEPRDRSSAITLATLLSTCPDRSLRDAGEAEKLALAVCRESGFSDPAALDILAAAYAEGGKIPEAIRTAEQALKIARERGNASLARDIESSLADYAAPRANK